MTGSSRRNPSAILLCSIQDRHTRATPRLAETDEAFGRFALLPYGRGGVGLVPRPPFSSIC